MGTQRDIAKKIVDSGADCILSVKGNQGSLEEEVKTAYKQQQSVFDNCIVEKGHGRIESRCYEVFEKGIIVDDENRWANLTGVIKITSIRELPKKTETQERFYLQKTVYLQSQAF
jgi:hypothetical protein